MTHVSNLVSIFPLKGFSLYKALTRKISILNHLRLFGSTVYVFIYKEEKKAQSAK